MKYQNSLPTLILAAIAFTSCQPHSSPIASQPSATLMIPLSAQKVDSSTQRSPYV